MCTQLSHVTGVGKGKVLGVLKRGGEYSMRPAVHRACSRGNDERRVFPPLVKVRPGGPPPEIL